MNEENHKLACVHTHTYGTCTNSTFTTLHGTAQLAMDNTYYPNETDEDYGGEGEGLCGLVGPGHSVQEAPDNEEGNREETACENDVPDPVVTAKLLEHVDRDKA